MVTHPATAGSSTTPETNGLGGEGKQPAHTRTYQACTACRNRKVRCDLGPVDNPHDPPCARCRRESKQCVFTATRRKRKPKDEDDDGFGEEDEYEIRNGTKRPRGGELSGLDGSNGQPCPPGGHQLSNSRSGLFSSPSTKTIGSNSREIKEEEDNTVNVLQRQEVFSSHDGINMLMDAARIGEDRHMSSFRHARVSSHSGLTPRNTTEGAPNSALLSSPQSSLGGSMNRVLTASSAGGTIAPGQSQGPQIDIPMDPAISGPFHPRRPSTSGTGASVSEEVARTRVIRAWRRLRFVRAGWFTPKEGMGYIDYFYQYLAPLTPIKLPNYNDIALQHTLLEQEPMLLVTMLTITSRFMKLSGQGAATRQSAIHEKLWTYLRGLMERTIWAQEQFGGGFCGAGGERRGRVASELGGTGLRTLGTVESFLLLTEWHPRAMHFPPGNDDEELLVPEDPHRDEYELAGDEDGEMLLNGTGGQRRESWLEPCWRSDRMCWMLLGYAISLAFELGVFDDMSPEMFKENNPEITDDRVRNFFARKENLKELLWIYFVQISGRLELISKLPKGYLESFNVTPVEQRLANRLASFNGTAPGDSPGRSYRDILREGSQYHDPAHRTVLYFWEEIAAIMKTGNLEMFPNRTVTRELIKTGRYDELLKIFQPQMAAWKKDFDECKIIPPLMSYILLIEYEYCRAYLQSLALQAVVERCTNNTPMQRRAEPHRDSTLPNGTTTNGSRGSSRDTTSPRPGELSSESSGPAISAATLSRWYGGDRKYITEVIDGCRNVLRIVVDGLLPNDYLKHCPVRTYFRIISVAVILLKTFALGATQDDVAHSLGLLDRAVDALRMCIVDDVHIGNRFADMCETLLARTRSRFVRLAAAGGTSSTAATTNGAATPHHPGQAGSGAFNGINANGVPVMNSAGHPHTESSPLTNQAHIHGLPLPAPTASMFPPPVPPLSAGIRGMGNSPSPSIAGAGPYAWSHPTSGFTSAAGGGLEGGSAAGTSAAGSASPYLPATTGPLYGISTETYDPGTGSLSIMPPPPGVSVGNGGEGYGDGGFGLGSAGPGAESDWLALPLNPLFENYGADVTATGYGPDVGGFDLLDVLLPVPADGNGNGH